MRPQCALWLGVAVLRQQQPLLGHHELRAAVGAQRLGRAVEEAREGLLLAGRQALHQPPVVQRDEGDVRGRAREHG